MHHTHQPVLVAFSIAIAILASFTALELAVSMVRQARHRLVWIAAGAVAMGAGIWSMHFVAMLAFTLPGVQIRYHVPLLVLSLCIGIAGSAVALFAASKSAMTRPVQVIGSVALGAAISGLHYVAIAAMRMPVAYSWDFRLVAASIAVALAVSFLGLPLAVRFREDLTVRGFLMRAAAGVVVGLAIAGMHYTAMAAMHFLPDRGTAPAQGGLLATAGLATAVIGATHLILAIGLAGCAVNRALARGRTRTEEALEAVRLRDEFLSIAAHELNTPVHSLQLAVQGITSGVVALTPDRMMRALRVAERQARRLSGLIDTLLDVSRIKSGRLRLHVDDVDLVAVVSDLLDLLADELAVAGCVVSVRTPSRPVVGRWDRQRLEQVVVNLVSNAAKFGRGAPIEIAVEGGSGAARLVVEDHGIGIPADRLKAIFGQFERAVPAQQYGGLGLGLYIVQSLVRMMGGTVAVRSSIGLGSTFVLTLPLDAPEAA